MTLTSIHRHLKDQAILIAIDSYLLNLLHMAAKLE